ncbi:hypothetical protein BD779DRAFT_1613609 [Infundibulicybe gibba]|nr:hypothetical protein BD779DRAFT_1613609 [Infundibulicybe gibba]
MQEDHRGGSQPHPLDADAQMNGLDGDSGEIPGPEDQPSGCTLRHPLLDGTPCDIYGNNLPPGTKPRPISKMPTNWDPFPDRAQFEIADFLYRKNQMSGSQINELLDLWAASLNGNSGPPFADKNDMYRTIDKIAVGDIPWKRFSITYMGPRPAGKVPPWMLAEYEVWYRDIRELIRYQLSNRQFNNQIDYAPLQEFGPDGERTWSNLMSGNWAWQQADIIGEDPFTHGATFVPVVLSSDKTTVSVATGQNEYYPLYASLGNVHNNIRRAHSHAMSIAAFLSIPKTDRQYTNDKAFRNFRRQLFHTSLQVILEPLHHNMTVPDITLCPDGHYRRVIYGLGPYIADYPEQVLLACVVQGWCGRCRAPRNNLDSELAGQRSYEHTALLIDALDEKSLLNDYGIISMTTPFTAHFPRTNIHELLAPDLLHQLIKGTFKDHLVTWVCEYLTAVHGEAYAAAVMADIDRRIAVVPPFPGIRQFPDGRGFKQWTGDDSKALMKVYLPAIHGHVPPQMVCALSAFLDFCYLVHRNIINEATLDAIDDALTRFHREREIFREAGIRLTGFSLPRQHSAKHYRLLIQMFGAPNGLCSSITEAKHIKAIKDLGAQMLVTNRRLEKLAAARVDFAARGMLNGPCISPHFQAQAPVVPSPPTTDDFEDFGEQEVVNEPRFDSIVRLARREAQGYPKTIHGLAQRIREPDFHLYLHYFLMDQLYPDAQVDTDHPPQYPTAPSLIAEYHDYSGIGGMLRQCIRSTPSWYNGPARRDCLFVNNDPNQPGMRGLHVIQAMLFFLFSFHQHRYSIIRQYPCALVRWFEPVDDEPCPDTGMWIFKPELGRNGKRLTTIIHLESVLHAAHLIGVCDDKFIPHEFKYTDSLDSFQAFFVNKFSDHHANELAF